jgi:capsular polysaccharide biosynthesis protein
LPFAEQVAAFAGASHVVGVHGAGMTNAVFCSPGTAVLEIFHPLYSTYGYAALALETGWRYAAMTARDWESDAAELNEPTLGDPPAARFGGRDIRVDIGLLRSWLDAAG